MSVLLLYHRAARLRELHLSDNSTSLSLRDDPPFFHLISWPILQALNDPKTVLFFLPPFHFPPASLGKFEWDVDIGYLSHLFLSFCRAGSSLSYSHCRSVGHSALGVSALARAFVHIGFFIGLVIVFITYACFEWL